MKRDEKFHITLHILAHLTEAGERPTTSEELAQHLHTNPVVIRRALGTLREAKIVASTKGHGGGWTLARAAETISLDTVYATLGRRVALAPVREPDESVCLIEQAVNERLDSFYAEAEALLQRRLADISLLDLAADYRQRRSAYELSRGHPAMPGD